MAAPPSFHVFMLDDLFPAPSDGLTMCSTLWSKLPVDLVEPILVRLPTSSQARFQAVCKTWQRLLRSQDFTKLSAAMAFSSGRYLAGFVSSHLPLDLKQSDLHVLDLQAQGAYKVHHLSLDFLPTHHRGLIFKQGLIVTGRRYRSGILGPRQQTVELYVVNPVNRTWRQLPDLRVPAGRIRCPVQVNFAVDDAGHGFQVTLGHWSTYVVEGYAEKCDRMVYWVYSSDCNAWSSVQDGSDEADTMDESDDLGEDIECLWPVLEYLEFRTVSDVALDYREHTVRGETFVVPYLWWEPYKTESWDGPWLLHMTAPLSMPKELMAKVRLPLPWMRRFRRAAIATDPECYRDHPEADDADGMDIQDWWVY